MSSLNDSDKEEMKYSLRPTNLHQMSLACLAGRWGQGALWECLEEQPQQDKGLEIESQSKRKDQQLCEWPGFTSPLAPSFLH